MSYGMRAWDAQGNLTFDSTIDLTLFPKTEQFIPGSSIGSSGITISYPQFAGKKIMPFLTSPYGNYYVDAMSLGNPLQNTTPVPAVMSCRVSYPNGIPTVSLFTTSLVDPATNQPIPTYDGYLVVMLTGSNQ